MPDIVAEKKPEPTKAERKKKFEEDKKRLAKQRQEEARLAREDRLAELMATCEFNMFVKDFVGKSHLIKVYDAMPIEKLRVLVEKKTGVPVNQQMLTFQSKIVMDGKKVADYGIKKDNNIFLSGGLDGFVLNYSKFVVYFYKK